MITEKFYPKRLNLLVNEWQYENVMSEGLFNSSLEYAKGYNTYGEANKVIQEYNQEGFFQIDKIFVNHV